MNMTNEQIQQLCAECEGWTNTGRKKLKIGEDYLGGFPPGEKQFLKGLPNYPADPAAALTLVESLAKEGWWITVKNWNLIEGETTRINWWAQFKNDQLASFWEDAPTLPLAICRAYLKVRGKL